MSFFSEDIAPKPKIINFSTPSSKTIKRDYSLNYQENKGYSKINSKGFH